MGSSYLLSVARALFSDMYCVKYFTIGRFMPQSLNKLKESSVNRGGDDYAPVIWTENIRYEDYANGSQYAGNGYPYEEFETACRRRSCHARWLIQQPSLAVNPIF
jgi:hypothetical protein